MRAEANSKIVDVVFPRNKSLHIQSVRIRHLLLIGPTAIAGAAKVVWDGFFGLDRGFSVYLGRVDCQGRFGDLH